MRLIFLAESPCESSEMLGIQRHFRSHCLLGLLRTGRCFQVRYSSELSPGGFFPMGSSSSLPPHVLGHDWLQNFAVGGPQTSPTAGWGAAGWECLTQCCWHHFHPGLCPVLAGESIGRGQVCQGRKELGRGLWLGVQKPWEDLHSLLLQFL